MMMMMSDVAFSTQQPHVSSGCDDHLAPPPVKRQAELTWPAGWAGPVISKVTAAAAASSRWLQSV